MDYVVFGIGFGATLLVVGLLIRDIGPRLRYRRPTDPDGVFHAEELVAKVSWSRFCGALGNVLALCGALFVLITAICMFFVLSDNTGGLVMLGALVALILLVAFWTWAFFDRFGSFGVLPEREVVEEAPVVETAEPRRPARRDERSVEPEPTATEVAASTTGAEDEPDEEATAAATPEDDTSEQVDPEHEDDQPSEEEDEEQDDDGGEEVTPDEPSSERLQTPEERLAASESPINHGSTEGDLDIASTTRRRLTHRNKQTIGPPPPQDLQDHVNESSDTDSSDPAEHQHSDEDESDSR